MKTGATVPGYSGGFAAYASVGFFFVAGFADPGRGAERLSERFFGREPDAEKRFRSRVFDDMADPKATDPVLRESTRVCAASVSVGQTSIDPDVIEGWLGPNVLKHPMIAYAVGETEIAEVIKKHDQYHDLYVEFSPVNHIDSNDPPLFMTCSAEMDLPSRDSGHGIHHPVYGVKLKEKSDQLGHECHLVIPGYSESKKFSDGNDFLFQMLLSSQEGGVRE